jgi:peroxiredoxin
MKLIAKLGKMSRINASSTFAVAIVATATAITAPPTLVAAAEPMLQQRTAFFRADASAAAKIPPVLLSKAHEKLCQVKVGDMLPTIELPQLGGGNKKLAALFGQKATVVVFWKGDRRMSQLELADLGPDVIEPFAKQGVAVVGVAVGESAATARALLDTVSANFPNLLDVDGRAFATVGAEKLPRTYLVDPQGKILWFDIEYSQATRRELHQGLRAVAGQASHATQE